ncbi:MAG: DsbA family protein [Salinisphaeraceae bacterium]|nr:DsbA family protein [Salinisphaeraceae bacterium]
MAKKPAPTPRSAITERIASSHGPINQLRARRFGLDLLLGQPPTLELYYEPGDPHSYLCAQLLPTLAKRLRCPLQVRTVPAPVPASYPEAEKQRGFALIDAKRIAPAWGLDFSHQAILPEESQRQTAAEQLVGINAPDEFAQREAELAQLLFAGKPTTTVRTPEHAKQLLDNNAKRRTWLGHYLPGMWQFNGEWFWGVDRLDILEQRLREKDLLEGTQPLIEFNAAEARLPALDAGHPLEFFFSFRSPYSYLAALDIQSIADSLPIDLQIRPVLPMAMRGFPVPLEKRLYIVRDVKRRADQAGQPFGRIADPIGSGAERCLNCFPLAENTAQQLKFLTTAGTAIWSQGIDVATDEGLQYVVETGGLDWAAAKAKLDAGIDLGYAEENRKALFEAGLWGVPSFRIGSFATWGQDRVWMVRELLARHAH